MTALPQKTGTLTSADGVKIFYRYYPAESERARSSLQFFKALDLDDKTLHVYDGLYHEIYNEGKDQRRQVLMDLEDWLEIHIIPKP